MDQHRVAKADTGPILPKALAHGEGAGTKADNAGADFDRAGPKALAQIADQRGRAAQRRTATGGTAVQRTAAPGAGGCAQYSTSVTADSAPLER